MPNISAAPRTIRACLIWGGLLVLLGAVPPVHGQDLPYVRREDLARFYREARFQMQIDKEMPRLALPLPILPPTRVASPSDTIASWIARQAYDYKPPKKVVKITSNVEKWQLVKRMDRFRYEKKFNEVKWSYLGNNYFTPLDTAYTREVRARMQARFGSPTRTLVELDYTRELRREEYIQFEYWFIVNDSIPMIVMDVNGPFDRGVVVACDHRYRNILYKMRESFLGTLMQDTQPAPYVDYYYNYPVQRWYRTGFDGRQFFTDLIGQPNLARGRPQLPSSGN